MLLTVQDAPSPLGKLLASFQQVICLIAREDTCSQARKLLLVCLTPLLPPFPLFLCRFELDSENKAKKLVMWRLQSPHVRAFHVSTPINAIRRRMY